MSTIKRDIKTPPGVYHGRVINRALLICGILSSVLYITTDILGGLRYDGYSFTSQAISELGAIGAPSKSFVDPLFTIYNVLALLFGVGLLREARQSRALQVSGWLLIGFGGIGLATSLFPADFFAMNQRGTGDLMSDLPHILLTAALLILWVLVMAIAAFALGTRFRIYSLATLLAVGALAALTAPFAAALAAGEPTPGFGIVERASVYTSLIWIAVFAIALLRRQRGASISRINTNTNVHGMVARGFEEVRAEFERNFTERGDIGAAVAVYWCGEKVVDLWGGRRNPRGDEPWNEDTMVLVNSTTKGLAAMTLAIANARGWLDYDAPVAKYWPQFAQNGKADITVRQLLDHEAGLVLLDEKLPVNKLRDLDYVARVLARQRPAWRPGTRHGYHTLTIGLYMQELIRHTDPQHRTLGRFFNDEIAKPLGVEFYIGLPREIPDARLARLKLLSRLRGLLALRYTPFGVTMKMIWPGSLVRRSFVGTNLDLNDRRTYELELPAGIGVGTARAIARAYSAFAEGGKELGITPATFAQLIRPCVPHDPKDAVLGVPSYFSLGFMRPGPDVFFGSSPHGFGAPGAGGSIGFADPDARLGFAYVTNKFDFYLVDDPREKALRDAVYGAISRMRATPKKPRPVKRMEPAAATEPHSAAEAQLR